MPLKNTAYKPACRDVWTMVCHLAVTQIVAMWQPKRQDHDKHHPNKGSMFEEVI
jgi:hypothetical protein